MAIKCCATCRKKFDMIRFDYFRGGCVHQDMGGYACTAFADEGQIIWMTGNNPGLDRCEEYEPKEANE